ncbi:MAG: phosphodiester glycosidase family protein [Actinomycetota bacterium]
MRWLARSIVMAIVVGLAAALGSVAAGAQDGDAPVTVAVVPAPGGAWMVDADGGVLALEDAIHHGGLTPFDLNSPVVGVAAHQSGEGYWLVAADGGVFAFGAAGFHGSMGGVELNSPVVGVAAHPSGEGYWLVAGDGGMFAFGAAGFRGSLGSLTLAAPIVGAAGTPGGDGYWLVAADGGIFSFGEAEFLGSAAELPLESPIAAIGAGLDDGYLLVSRDGDVFAYGAVGYPGGRDRVARLAPDGWRIADVGRIAPGVEHRVLDSDRQIVTVVEVSPLARLDAVVAPAGDGPFAAGGGARTSTLCEELSCVVGVNGDFFDLSDREPVGGVVVDGELIRTPRFGHEQLSFLDDGSISVGRVIWAVRLVPAEGRTLLPVGINVGVEAEDQLVVFTPAAGPATPAVPLPPPPPPPEPDPDAPEEEPDPDAPPPEPPPPPPPDPVTTLLARQVDPGPLRLDATWELELTERVEGRVQVDLPDGTVALVGRGASAAALDELWVLGEGASVRLEVDGDPSIVHSVGGAPPVLRDGERLDPGQAGFVISRNPRTVVGQRSDGTLVFVTVDGRRPPERLGLSIADLTDLLVALDVDTAINLDGGGSTTLVAGGVIRNSLADGSERRVANAVLMIPR